MAKKKSKSVLKTMKKAVDKVIKKTLGTGKKKKSKTKRK